MEFFIETKFDQRKKADLLVVPCLETDHGTAEFAAKLGHIEKRVNDPIKTGDFQGKRGEITFLYGIEGPEVRIALLGLGKMEKCSVETIRRAFGLLGRACHQRKITTMNIVFPELLLTQEESVRGIVEGLLLVNYSFQKLKGEREIFNPIQKVCFFGRIEKIHERTAKKLGGICEGVYLARDLVNDNADTITPQYLADFAKSLGRKHKNLHVTVLDKKKIKKEKMGLLLAVNRGSDREPALIIIEYRGNSKSKDHTVVIGKGITYDTGGLNIKSSGMETMRADMAGAAICFGLLTAAVKIGIKKNFTIVIPSTENCTDSKSYKPGDVYTSYSGKTVEIGNTDAEGRLVLVDAISYAVKRLKPTRVIDFATLTGAIDVALGAEATGLMSNDDHFANSLISAGKTTFERLWRMPLYEEYREQLKSDIADLKNVGSRSGSASIAAKFIEEFVGNIPWAHCDIASTAFLAKAKDYLPKNATGVGVRLMIEFFEQKKHEKSS